MSQQVKVLVSVGYEKDGYYTRFCEPVWVWVSLKGGECRFHRTPMLVARRNGMGIVNAIGFHLEEAHLGMPVSFLKLDQNMAFFEEIDVDLNDHNFDPTVLLNASVKKA